MSSDFANAQHGSTPIGFGGVHFPTVEKSISGGVFIAIGVILGVLFDVYQLDGFIKRNPQIKGIFFAMLVGGPVLAGAWLGARLHQVIGEGIKKAKEANAAHMQSNQEAERSEGHGSEARIIYCKKCNQKLRVPGGQPELLVTCTSCGHKFSCPPG